MASTYIWCHINSAGVSRYTVGRVVNNIVTFMVVNLFLNIATH